MEGIRNFFVVTLLAVFPAHAQQVYKCVEGGKTAYQSAPCAGGAAVKTWDAPPDAPNPYREARLNAIQRDLDQRKQMGGPPPRRYGTNGVAISKYRDPGRCEAAKAQRAAAHEAAGVRRTFEQSRRLDDMVYDACK